ncbi:TetR/AcrR family transcriptional regulator [Patulibacter defluvii]|uniref:TetR/AcrR family transcriptional regulator n=1 Tax=Patulibacter defluvii TaxID=3095358 RepID=UPI002A765A8F|nr:TetR/AcrR family transcriptional regulator [Patulibacter sp. DM4]
MPRSRSTDQPPTRKRISRPEREARMLDAAEEVFAAHSFQAASMEEIARRSGITKALLYQYFGSKEGLYEATVERGRAQLFAALAAAVEGEPTGGARLLAVVRGYFDYVAANRGHWWLLYGQAGSAAVNAMRDRNAEMIAGLLADGRDDLDDEALAIVAHAIVGAGEQVGRWWAVRPDVPQERVVAQFVALTTGAIKALLPAG